MKYHLDSVEEIFGFLAEPVLEGDTCKVITQGAITSDDPMFYRCIEEITRIYLRRFGSSANLICHFLILVHEDNSAEVHVNDFPVELEVRVKRPTNKGAELLRNNVADIRMISFPEVSITATDRVIYCFKAGWRFGLVFDLGLRKSRSQSEDQFVRTLNWVEVTDQICNLYRRLHFYQVYKVLESSTRFMTMLDEGWFPFIALLPDDYEQLSAIYEMSDRRSQFLDSFLRKFDRSRIESVAQVWWQTPIFASKRKMLQSGLDSYIQNAEAGFIACSKILLSEFEGILRQCYYRDLGIKKRLTTTELIRHIAHQGKAKAGSETSLLLPSYFLEYLCKVLFADFDVSSGNVPLSRHSASHGEARAEDYTRARALQIILALDQLVFYL